MASGQALLSEISTDKQALNNIFQFLKHQNLKETEEALKKELGIPMTSSSSSVTSSSCSQPEEVEEAYSKAKPPHKRSRSFNVSVCREEDEDMEEEEEEEEDEEEGPHSWPGTFQSTTATTTTPMIFSSKKVNPIVPFRTPVLTAPPSTAPPLVYKPFPTLFTLVPPGLIGSTTPTAPPPPLINTLMTTQPVTSVAMSPVITTSPVTTPTLSLPPPTHKPSNATTLTLSSIPPEEMTPVHHELKAFAEEFKTKRIQLGYTQGAVGQSLADKGYSNFAQSTISRFEQMQLSPSNAATIMTVLKRWLYEAENPDMVSSTSNNTEPLGPPRKRKKRVVYTPQALSVLNSYFQKEPRPNRQIIEIVAEELDLLPEEVRVWFCNKRQKKKSSCDLYEDTYQVEVPSPSPSSPRSAHSPSPPRTKFTIEELSKSSLASNNTPLSFTSHLTTTCTSVSPQQVLRPMVFANRGQIVSVTI